MIRKSGLDPLVRRSREPVMLQKITVRAAGHTLVLAPHKGREASELKMLVVALYADHYSGFAVELRGRPWV